MLTKEDAVAQISIKLPALAKEDIQDLLSPELTDADRAFIVKFYKDSGAMPSKSFWDVFLEVISVCESAANLIIPITAAISGIYSITTIGKS